MKSVHGGDVFENGCPVCKFLCCCGDKTLYCQQKYHCYKKCPVSKLQSSHSVAQSAQHNARNVGGDFDNGNGRSYGNESRLPASILQSIKSGCHSTGPIASDEDLTQSQTISTQFQSQTNSDYSSGPSLLSLPSIALTSCVVMNADDVGASKSVSHQVAEFQEPKQMKCSAHLCAQPCKKLKNPYAFHAANLRQQLKNEIAASSSKLRTIKSIPTYDIDSINNDLNPVRSRRNGTANETAVGTGARKVAGNESATGADLSSTCSVTKRLDKDSVLLAVMEKNRRAGRPLEQVSNQQLTLASIPGTVDKLPSLSALIMSSNKNLLSQLDALALKESQAQKANEAQQKEFLLKQKQERAAAAAVAATGTSTTTEGVQVRERPVPASVAVGNVWTMTTNLSTPNDAPPVTAHNHRPGFVVDRVDLNGFHRLKKVVQQHEGENNGAEAELSKYAAVDILI